MPRLSQAFLPWKNFSKFGNPVKSTITCVGLHSKPKIYEEYTNKKHIKQKNSKKHSKKKHKQKTVSLRL